MRVLAFIGALALIAAAGVAAFLLGGLFDIGAAWEDPAFVKAAIARVRDASVERHATDSPPAGFDAAARVQAGARTFSTVGCVNCHGAPGVKWQKFSEGLNPDPPDLKDAASDLTPAQVFWIAKHGIRMTGMPSFAAAGVSDADLWSIVAFVKKLPQVSEADYKAWTTAQAPTAAEPAKQ